MNNFINGYISRNSIIHRMNPALKMLMFISFVILIFIPVGLIVQVIVWLIVSGLFFLAKLPGRIYFSTIKSIIFMFLILFFINWFTYRNPGTINLDMSNPESIIKSGFFTPIGTYQDVSFSNIFDGTNFFNANSFHLPGSDSISVTFQQAATTSFNGVHNYVGAAGYNQFLADLGSAYPNVILPRSNGVVNLENFQMIVSRVAGAELKGLDVAINSNTNTVTIVPIYHFAGYALSIRTLVMTLFITQKIYMMILLATILTSTSTSIELTFAIEQLLSPLKWFRLPVNALAMTISIAIRFVPSLLLESQRILNAQASRGIDFKNGKFWERGNALISLIVPMVSIAFRNAAELSNAMEARSYSPRFARTRYRVFKIHFIDWAFYLFLMICVGLGIYIVSNQILFNVFGTPEWLVQGYAINAVEAK